MKPNEERAIDWAELRARLATITTEHEPAADPERASRILEERARLLARPTERSSEQPQLSVVVFSAHGERYAIEIAYVRETVRSSGMTRLPGVPEWFVGVESVRGEIVAVVDLGRLFGVPSVALHDVPSWLIVIGEQESELALCCNEVSDVVALPRARIVPPPTGAMADGRRDMLGVTDDAIVVLDGARLLADERLFVEQDEVVEV